MATSIADKLKIKPKFTLLTLNAPPNFKKGLVGLPTGVKINDTGKDHDQVHWFVTNRAQLEKEMSKVMRLVKPEVVVWVYYPKGSSKIQTDLTRDKGWDCLLAESDKLTWISLISFDDTWSVFGFRAKSEADRKKNKKEAGLFEALSFSNKREYLEWVVTAKREETRAERIKGMIERLGKGWKNPANR
jgi:hypothetical protein